MLPGLIKPDLDFLAGTAATGVGTGSALAGTAALCAAGWATTDFTGATLVGAALLAGILTAACAGALAGALVGALAAGGATGLAITLAAGLTVTLTAGLATGWLEVRGALTDTLTFLDAGLALAWLAGTARAGGLVTALPMGLANGLGAGLEGGLTASFTGAFAIAFIDALAGIFLATGLAMAALDGDVLPGAGLTSTGFLASGCFAAAAFTSGLATAFFAACLVTNLTTGLAGAFLAAGGLALVLARVFALEATGFLVGLDFLTAAFTSCLLADPATPCCAPRSSFGLSRVIPCLVGFADLASAADCSDLPEESPTNLRNVFNTAHLSSFWSKALF